MPISEAPLPTRRSFAAARGFVRSLFAQAARPFTTAAWLAAVLPWLAAACLALSGCGAPAPPDARHPVTPLPVTDLTARQQGDAVVLSFTLPSTSTDQDPLAMPPSVEIYAGSLAPGAALPKKPDTRLVNTIPGDLTKNYLVAGRFQFAAPFDAGEVARSAGEQEIYQVRTRAFKGGPSDLSSVLVFRAYPPPAAIQDLRAAVTEPAIVLSWTQPDRTSTGGALPGALSVRVYRTEVPVPAAPSAGAPAAAPAAASSAPQNPPPADFAMLLQLLASPPAAPSAPASSAPSPSAQGEYRDAVFAFGHVYLYSVRTVISYGSNEVESADSNLLTVPAKDVFPPAAPQTLVAVVTPALAGMPPYVELTWAISPEPDLAGYIVYRADQADEPGQRLNQDLLPAPSFRDTSALPAHRYFYRVTAVDTSGNESAPSSTVAVDAP